MTRITLALFAIVSLAMCPAARAAGNLEDLERSAKVGPYGAGETPSVSGMAPHLVDTEPYGYIATARVVQGASVADSTTTVALKNGRVEIGEASGPEAGAKEALQ